VVLYGMLKSMTPYDEDKHGQQLGLVAFADQTSSTPVDVSVEVVDLAELQNDLAPTIQASPPSFSSRFDPPGHRGGGPPRGARGARRD
jgi:hypothetical protein